MLYRGISPLSDEERVIFRVGEGAGPTALLTIYIVTPGTRTKIENLVKDIKAKEGDAGLEQAINDMVDRYI